MRRIATGLVVFMAIAFLATAGLAERSALWGYVHAFAEAALVGSLADWFAVTALFRHPLGLPIPHTAIIPQNKDRIADTMAGFLKDNFLTPQVVARRMQEMNLARAVGQYLGQPGERGDSRVLAGAGQLGVEILESLDPDRLGMQVRAGLAGQLEKVRVAPLLGQALEAMIADGRHRPLIDALIKRAGLVIEDNEPLIRAMIHERANALLRFTGLDERLANSVLDGLYRMLAEVLIDPDHPLRGKVDEGLRDLAHNLQHDPVMQAKVERMKNDLLANPALTDWWQGVWERIRRALIDMLSNAGSGQGVPALRDAMQQMGAALRDDPRLQAQVNRFARRTAVGVSNRYGGQIVQLVSETVRRWDATTVTDRVESAVGRDLQFIRINGTLVGGLVGLVLHGIMQLL